MLINCNQIQTAHPGLLPRPHHENLYSFHPTKEQTHLVSISKLIIQASKWYLTNSQMASSSLSYIVSYDHCCILEFVFFFCNNHKIKSPKGQTQGSSFQTSTIPTSFESCFSGKGPHLLLLLPEFKIYHHTLGRHNCVSHQMCPPIGRMVWPFILT